MMRVSSGELLAQLRQSFEALGVSQGEYETAAASVLALELWGFGGLTLLEMALPRLESYPQWPPSVSYDGSDLIVDCFQGSALFGLIPCIELVYVKARQGEYSQATFKNCFEPAFIVPLLIQICQRGYSAGAHWWLAGDEPQLCLVGLQGDSHGVQIASQVWAASGEVEEGQLSIYIARESRGLLSYQESLIEPSFCLKQNRSNDDLQALFQQSAMSSISIDPWLWERLRNLGQGILVPTTEESRRGAGADGKL